MTVRFKIELDLFGEIAENLRPQALKVCRKTANRIRTGARGKIRTRGRVLLTSSAEREPGAKPRRYWASPPGGPPAKNTGELMRAMRVRRTGRLTMQVDFGTGKSGMDHVARILEGGTARIAARPFFYQTVVEAGPFFEAEMSTIFDEAAKGSGGEMA